MIKIRHILESVSVLILVLLTIVGCTAATQGQSLTPTATPTPAPSPTLVPTATPAPALPGLGQPHLSTSTPLVQPPITPIAILQLPDVVSVVEKARPAVVSIVAEMLLQDIFGRTFKDFQNGSGVIFDSAGFVLTNNHVVQGAAKVTVTLEDSRQLEAKILGTDRFTDLAVLKIEGGKFPFVPLGDPSRVRVGDWVVAIGNALALPGGPTVTVGVVSALDRSLEVGNDIFHDFIQTDAAINPGNSGGPLLNLKGEIVGINTAIFRRTLEGQRVEGIGFAVAMSTAIPVAQQLIEKGRVAWPWLGVLLGELDAVVAARVGLPIREGLIIRHLVEGGPAWKGGVRRGDILLSLGGKKVPTVRELTRLLRLEFKVGETIESKVFRDGRELTLRVTLEERPSQ